MLFSFVAVRGVPNLWLLLRMTVVVTASMITVGCVNEYCDRAIDAQFKPWRPIPSGRITPRTALLVAVAACSILILVGSSLGAIGLLGALAGTGAGLAHDLGLKRSALSWLPFVIGYSIQPLWIWALVGHFSRRIAEAPAYAFLLILGLYLADQLPDAAERELGAAGLVHRLGSERTQRTALLSLLLAPVPLAAPLLWRHHDIFAGVFLVGAIVFYSLLGLALWLWLSRGKDYRTLKLGFLAIEVGALALFTSWLWVAT